MKLIKASDGLLEIENFYLTSPFPDFLGEEGIIHRDDENFYIDGNSKIERNFTYSNFVIELYKLNWENINITDEFIFYIGSDSNLYGIKDDISNGQSQYLKIICNDGYIQTYMSNDKKIWNNLGGIELKADELIIKQGFQKNSKQSLLIKDYKVYSSPYITVQNLPENYKAELYDENNNLLKTRIFDENMKCEIFLDYCLNGYIKLYNDKDVLIYETDLLYLQYGDTYTYSDYDLELYYMNENITPDPSTMLNIDDGGSVEVEEVILKNVSLIDNYANLEISSKTKEDEVIKLSLDNETFNDTVVIEELDMNQEVSIYIQITKGSSNHNFICRNFQLLVSKI